MRLSQMTACLLVAGSVAFTSCKKKTDPAPTADSETLQQSSDNNDVKSESDKLNGDVNDAFGNYSDLNTGGRLNFEEADTTVKQICGCTISRTGPKKINLHFDGTTNCDNAPRRVRGGDIDVELVSGQFWAQEHAVLKITMRDYKVTRASDSKSITFNGVKTMTNTRGFHWGDVLTQRDSIVYHESGDNIVATFDGGATHTFSVRRGTALRYVTIAGLPHVRFRASGDTTFNGLPGIDTWGTNRFGNAFTSQFTVPWISNNYCNVNLAWPNQGQYVIKANGNTLTATFGVDQQGNPNTNDCAYGWMLGWQLSNGQSGSQVLSY